MANHHESDDDATQDLPLSAAFARARQMYQKNNSGGLSTSERREAVRLLTSSQAMIESLGLFSSNEDMEDLATAYIKYLLVPFFLADILASSSSKALQERVQLVNTALCQHRTFLETCSQYQLLGSYASVYQREEEGLKIDHSMRREIKVAWFKQQRALNAQLQALEGASGSRVSSTLTCLICTSATSSARPIYSTRRQHSTPHQAAPVSPAQHSTAQHSTAQHSSGAYDQAGLVWHPEHAYQGPTRSSPPCTSTRVWRTVD
jgi:hypothetical protein